jgi:hypothetical protein
MTCRSSATEWPTAVKCPTGVSVVSAAIRPVIRTVRSRVEPPAPYVTDTKVGRSGSSWRTASQSCCSSAAVLGGMNSKENDRSPAASRSRMAAARCGQGCGIVPG